MSRCTLLKSLNSAAFRSCSKLTTVYLPPNVEALMYGVFDSTTSLKSIVLPDSVTEIYPFSGSYGRVFGNSGLEEIIITESSKLEKLGEGTFFGTKLKNFYIPQNLTSMNAAAFSGCPIEQITIHPDNKAYKTDGKVIYIGENNSTLFYVSSSLTGTFTVPSFVTTIGYSAMRGGSLTSIILHDDITSIENYAFSGNPIVEFSFPKLITNVPASAFYSCQKLEKVRFTENITTISGNAFNSCIKLKTVILPKSLKIIKDHAFMRCTSLTSISLPEGITTIEDGVFQEIKLIFIDGSVMYIDNNNNKTLLQYFGANNNMKITVPQTCAKISGETFAGKSVGSVIFSDNPSLTVGDNAFKGSTLKSIEFPVGLTSLGTGTFQDCLNLLTVNFAGGTVLTSIPDNCFANCQNLRNFVLPTTIQSIGHSSFTLCKSLGDIWLSNTVVQNISQSAFVQSGLTNANLPSTIENIGQFAFMESSITSFAASCDIPTQCCQSCQMLSSLTLNENVHVINDYAFDGCSLISSFTIPTTLDSILNFAFRSCTSLSSINLPLNSNLNQVIGGCFYNCIKLKKMTLSSEDKRYRFENGALTNYNQTRLITFLPYSDIQNFVVPQDMETIGKYAFMGSPNLIRVMFYGNKIREIGLMAFKDCIKLSFVYFSSSSLKSIGDKAFDGCKSLHKCGTVSVPLSLQSKFVDRVIFPVAFSTNCNFDCQTVRNTYYSHITFLTPFIILFLS